jgi:hypothetical protein
MDTFRCLFHYKTPIGVGSTKKEARPKGPFIQLVPLIFFLYRHFPRSGTAQDARRVSSTAASTFRCNFGFAAGDITLRD